MDENAGAPQFSRRQEEPPFWMSAGSSVPPSDVTAQAQAAYQGVCMAEGAANGAPFSDQIREQMMAPEQAFQTTGAAMATPSDVTAKVQAANQRRSDMTLRDVIINRETNLKQELQRIETLLADKKMSVLLDLKRSELDMLLYFL